MKEIMGGSEQLTIGIKINERNNGRIKIINNRKIKLNERNNERIRTIDNGESKWTKEIMGRSKVWKKQWEDQIDEQIMGGSETIDNGGSKWTKEIMGGSEQLTMGRSEVWKKQWNDQNYQKK